MSNSSLGADADQIAAWLKVLVEPGSTVEMRVLFKPKRPTISHYKFDDLDRMAQAAVEMGSEWQVSGRYWLMNPLPFNWPAGQTATDKDIVRRRWLLVDLDPKRKGTISSNHQEKEAARLKAVEVNDYLTEHGWPVPLVCDSGNGFHLLYRIDLPGDDGGLVHRVLQAMAGRFDDDVVGVDTAVANASRICKLYGTLACKGKNTTERPHRASAIITIPETLGVVAGEMLEKLAGEVGRKPHLPYSTPGIVRPVTGQLISRLTAPADRVSHPGDIERARLYLAKCDPAIEGESGSDRILYSASKLVNKFGLTDGEAFNLLLREYNPRCEPRWSEAEIWHKIDDAHKNPPARAAKGTSTRSSPASAYANGWPVDATKGQPTAEAAAAESPFKTWSMAELDAAEFHLTYLVDGLLVAGQPCIIAAAKKSLKTNIACDLMLSLASGSKFLGKFWTPEAVRVALMTGESGDATIQETLRRIARSKPWINLADYENAFCSFELPKIGQPQTKLELTSFIVDNGLQVLIIDPAYLCLDLDSSEAGNLFSVGKKLRELTDIGQLTDCTVTLIHHNKKSMNDQFGVPELESIAWSGFQEWARQWLLIGRREAYNPEAAGSHRLWLSAGGSAGHSGCWALDLEEGDRKDQGGRRWEVVVHKASAAIASTIQERESLKTTREEEKTARRIAADAEKLLKQYRKKPEGDTAKFYRDSVPLSGTRFTPANETLLDDGLIEPFRFKKHTREEPGFRLIVGGGTGGTVVGLIPPVPACSVVVGQPPIRGVQSHHHTHNGLASVVADGEISPGIDPHKMAKSLFGEGVA